MTSYLERYQSGEYEKVWNDLVLLGSAVRQEPVYADALAVAREIMRRVRQDIEILIDRLVERHFLFGYDHRVQPVVRSEYPAGQRREYHKMVVWECELSCSTQTSPPLTTTYVMYDAFGNTVDASPLYWGRLYFQ